MTPKIEDEIKQTKPFRNVEEQFFITLARTTEVLSHPVEQTIQQAGITGTQYNALRILAGAGEKGLPCFEVGERMVNRVPDVTRLLDRLEKNGYVRRERSKENRRKVFAFITKDGLSVLEKLDKPLQDTMKKVFGKSSKKRLKEFIELMDELREGL